MVLRQVSIEQRTKLKGVERVERKTRRTQYREIAGMKQLADRKRRNKLMLQPMDREYRKREDD